MATLTKRKKTAKRTRPSRTSTRRSGIKVASMKVNIIGGSSKQQEALAWLIHDYLYHNRNMNCRNVDSAQERECSYPERIAQQELAGVQVDVCMPDLR